MLQSLKLAGVYSTLAELAELLETTETTMREVSSGRQHSLPRAPLDKLRAICEPRGLDWTVFFDPSDYPDLSLPMAIGLVHVKGVFNLSRLEVLCASPLLQVWQSPAVLGLIVRFSEMPADAVYVIQHPFAFNRAEARVSAGSSELLVFVKSETELSILLRQEGFPKAGGIAVLLSEPEMRWKFFGG